MADEPKPLNPQAIAAIERAHGHIADGVLDAQITAGAYVLRETAQHAFILGYAAGYDDGAQDALARMGEAIS